MEIRKASRLVAENLKNNLIVAEIGVRGGQHALGMLEILNIKRLYLVDHYQEYQDNGTFRDKRQQDEYYKEMFQNMRDKLDKVVFITKPSKLASELFKNEYFDFIYIDACHEYKNVKEDIDCWYPKIKKGGYLGGHDYNTNWKGVVKAVDKFIKNKNLKLLLKDNDWLIKKT
ncbi:MAG: class I SAM-dependent methyltransferase [Candidatus Helarchaeota archaeon]